MNEGVVPREVLGRFHLWYLALFECDRLLRDALRARAAHERLEFPHGEIDDAYRDGPFGHWVDLDCAFHNYAVLAAVYFCQVFNSGRGVGGIASPNLRGSANKEREELVTRAFPNAVERKRFGEYLKRLFVLRDRVIAHADGGQFGISHGDTIIVSATHASVVQEMELDYFHAAVKKLLSEVEGRLHALDITTGWVR